MAAPAASQLVSGRSGPCIGLGFERTSAYSQLGMSFVIPQRPQDGPETPEALFRGLRPRDPSVRDLLLRQGDVLREYTASARNASDVAVELPTGGGKTLVGLLIAEWRRRTLGNRVAYLCPTKQLVNQVAGKAHDYGLDVVTLVGPQGQWEPADFNRFQRAQSIAIAGYYQVFNSNPRLSSAQTLILDDAHAAEDAVASNWSINAARGSLLYRALLAAFGTYLADATRRQVESDDTDPRYRFDVALVPAEAMLAVSPAIEGALAEYATDREDPNKYAKAMIGARLDRCLAYVSWSEILIRPLISPTSTHPPFSGADQRVYMSATLGSAGELQRAFGVDRVATVSPPAGDDQGFGRRFFVMPHAARNRPDEVTAAAVEAGGRSVILAPSNAEADQAAERLVPDGVPVLHARDIESGFEPFVGEARAALVLANRYDGIDLPDQACRLVVLTGLPAHAHAQERFIMDVLGARRVLSERIRTRIQQGAGRATRNARDFAAVIIRGEALTDFLSRDEEVRSFPPQLQAEIDFGFTNSEDPGANIVGLLATFWAQGEEWQPAEDALAANAGRATRMVTREDHALAASAEKEVACWQALFSDDFPRAIDLAQEVTDRLIGGEELRPYRALWFYLAASWAARLASADTDGWAARAAELRREADGAARPLRWTPRWLNSETDEAEMSLPHSRGVRAAAKLRSLGIRGGRFEEYLLETSAGLGVDKATDFEDGLLRLGELLGFDAVRPSGQADPDGAWRDGTDVWILFEAKTQERPDTALSPETVRQASTHDRWVESELGWERPQALVTTIVTYKQEVGADTPAIAGDVRMVTPGVVREIADRTFEALREARAAARGLSDGELAQKITAAFLARGLDTETVAADVGPRAISNG